MDILSLLSCFSSLLDAKTFRQFGIISQAVLTMTGRVTMLNISRWTDKGGSYRTCQRFFLTVMPWTQMLVLFFQTQLFDPRHEYILAGDETVVGKAGEQSFGIDRLFSGTLGKTIRGLGFFVFSLVDTSKRKSYPLAVRQMVRSEAEKELAEKRRGKRRKKKKNGCQNCGQKKKSSRPGRGTGSKNRDKNEFKPSPEVRRIDGLLKTLVSLLRHFIKLGYVVLDGHFGHNQAMLMALENDLHLITKMRIDAALYEKYEGEQAERGAKRKYGERLDYQRLPKKYLKQSRREKGVITNYYQGKFLHKEFGRELNAVIIEKINLTTNKRGHAVLFSSDAQLEWEKLADYYCLRFQIEFNFREAKQHFGLEDFMVTRQTGVENAANLSFMMVNVSEKLKDQSNEKCVSTNDLKTHYRGVKYARLTLKKIVKKAEPILINEIIEEVSRLGSIHQPKPTLSSA